MPADRLTDAELTAAIAECREWWRARVKVLDIAGVSSDSHMRQMPRWAAERLSLLHELAELRVRVAGAKRIIRLGRFYDTTKFAWGPTPGVPGEYGYYWEGEYVGSLEAAMAAAGKTLTPTAAQRQEQTDA